MRAPVQTLPEVQPTGAVPTGFTQRATPEDFGAGVGRAVEGIGAAGDVASDRLFRVAMYKQDLVNETTAMQAVNQMETAQANYLHDPKTGFYLKKGQDALNGYTGAQKDLNDMYATTRASLPNDAARRMFDSQALRLTRYSILQAGSHADQETQRWMLQTADASIANVINNGAQNWNDPREIERNLGRISGEVLKKGELEGASPEKVQADTAHYQSTFLMSVGHQALVHDPGYAQKVLNTYRGQMDAGHVASLDSAITNKVDVETRRAIAWEDHLAARAHRDMTDTQAKNYGDFAARALSGQNVPTTDELATAMRTQQLTPAQADGVIALSSGRKASSDNPAILPDFLKRAHAGGDPQFADDVAAAAKGRDLTPGTMDSLLKTASGAAQRGDDQIEKGLFNSLKTAVGVTPTTVFDFTKQGEKDKAALVSQMESEWTQRVFQKHEPPQQVFDDMLPRFAKSLPNDAASLPQPRLGAVTSTQDIGAVWQKTREAADTGKITQDQMQSEADLLRRYQTIFAAQEQAARDRAAKPLTPGGVKPKNKPNE